MGRKSKEKNSAEISKGENRKRKLLFLQYKLFIFFSFQGYKCMILIFIFCFQESGIDASWVVEDSVYSRFWRAILFHIMNELSLPAERGVEFRSADKRENLMTAICWWTAVLAEKFHQQLSVSWLENSDSRSLFILLSGCQNYSNTTRNRVTSKYLPQDSVSGRRKVCVESCLTYGQLLLQNASWQLTVRHEGESRGR